jgi:hypothetical protein
VPPDIGHGPDWQGKAGPESFLRMILSENRVPLFGIMRAI